MSKKFTLLNMKIDGITMPYISGTLKIVRNNNYIEKVSVSVFLEKYAFFVSSFKKNFIIDFHQEEHLLFSDRFYIDKANIFQEDVCFRCDVIFKNCLQEKETQTPGKVDYLLEKGILEEKDLKDWALFNIDSVFGMSFEEIYELKKLKDKK